MTEEAFLSSLAQAPRRLVAVIRLGRPHFLAGGIAMNALGVSAALYAGASLNLAALVLGQVVITSIQWMVHYANDYFDLVADSVNASSTFWSGGSRVLQGGDVPPRLAYRTAIALAAVAVLATIALLSFAHAGPATLAIVGLSLFFSWGYSAPPFRWVSSGFGETITAFVVAVLTPAFGFYLQAGYIPAWFLLVLLPVFCLQLCFQLNVSFPDAPADAAAGKQTLVVRRPTLAVRLYMGCIAVTYLVVPPLMILAGLPLLATAAIWLSAPIALWLVMRARRQRLAAPPSWDADEWGAVLLLALTVPALAAAFLVSQ